MKQLTRPEKNKKHQQKSSLQKILKNNPKKMTISPQSKSNHQYKRNKKPTFIPPKKVIITMTFFNSASRGS